MSGWNSKQVILQFIEVYHSLPALWKVKFRGYTNKSVRELAYAKLIHFCQGFHPAADKLFVLRKINNLRSNFQKEFKKVKRSKLAVSRDGEGKVYKPRLWYYPYLLFIEDQHTAEEQDKSLEQQQKPLLELDSATHKDHMEPTSPEDAWEHSNDLEGIQIHQAEEDNDPLEMFAEQSPQSSPCSQVSSTPDDSQTPAQNHNPPRSLFFTSSHELSSQSNPVKPFASRSRKRNRDVDGNDELHTTEQRPVNSSLPAPLPAPDANDLFGNTIALLLKKTSREQNIYARKLMYEVMAEAELGNLSRASYFVARPGPTSQTSSAASVVTNGHFSSIR